MAIDADFGQTLRNATKQIQPSPRLKSRIMELIELKNRAGDTLARIDIDSFTPLDPMNEIRKQIRPGTGIAIYVVDNNPERVIRNETFYECEPWSQGLEELLQIVRPYTFKVIPNAQILDIGVIYGFEYVTDDEAEEMYREAVISGQKMVTRRLQKSGNIVGIDISYKVGSRNLTVIALRTTKSRIHVPDIENHHIERLTVGLHDAVYLSDGTDQQLIWVEELPYRMQYEIRAKADISQHELLDLASLMFHPIAL